jgi:hypothetical protein
MFQMPRLKTQDKNSNICRILDRFSNFLQSTSISTMVSENRKKVRKKCLIFFARGLSQVGLGDHISDGT